MLVLLSLRRTLGDVMSDIMNVPVLDPASGQYFNRDVIITGCMAHIGDGQIEPTFRLYLAIVGSDGKKYPIGVDSIDESFLQGFVDQISRLNLVLIAGGERSWAGTQIDFSAAKFSE